MELSKLVKGIKKNSPLVICGFPGVGKTTAQKELTLAGLKVADSDSSNFDKSDFPKNYVDHLENIMGDNDIIFISTHKSVRDELVKRGIDFKLVYPSKELKTEYTMRRYVERGNTEAFIDLLNTNFDEWIEECENQRYCEHYKITNPNETMLDQIALMVK